MQIDIGGERRSVIETDDGPVIAHNAKHARWLRMKLAGEDMATREDCRGMIQESGYQCAYCGVVLPRMTIDHVIPLSRGGEHVLDNIKAACHGCNSMKSDMTLEEFRAKYFGGGLFAFELRERRGRTD